MTKIPALKFRNEMGEMLDQVRIKKEPLIITKHNKPIAVVLGLELIDKKNQVVKTLNLSQINKRLAKLVGKGTKISLSEEKLAIENYLGRKY